MRFPIHIPFVALLVIAGHGFAFHAFFTAEKDSTETAVESQLVRVNDDSEEERQKNPLLISSESGEPSPAEAMAETSEEGIKEEEEFDIADLANASEETYEPKGELPEEVAVTKPKTAVEAAMLARKQNGFVDDDSEEPQEVIEPAELKAEPITTDMPAIPKPENTAEKKEEAPPTSPDEPRRERKFVPVEGIASH